MYPPRSIILTNYPELKEGVYVRDIVERVEGNRVLSINGAWIDIKKTNQSPQNNRQGG